MILQLHSIMKPQIQSKLNKLLLIILFLGLLPMLKAQSNDPIYHIKRGDSTLSEAFVNELCTAARYPETNPTDENTKLEELILKAAGTSYSDSLSSVKTNKWYLKYGLNVSCPADSLFPQGNFLRQVVHSNFREFANLIGPNRALELNVLAKTDADNLSLYEYTNELRKVLEAKHDNRRFEFQQDEEWRNIMFFYFLFSEYKINYEQNLEK